MKSVLGIMIFSFLIEFWSEHQNLLAQQTIQSQLDLLPTQCRRYLKTSHLDGEYTTDREHGSLLSYFSLWWEGKEVTECRRFVEELERKRVKVTWPNPVFVSINLFSKCVLFMTETAGESIGRFAHGVLSVQQTLMDELLLLCFSLVFLVVVLMWLRTARIYMKERSRSLRGGGFAKEEQTQMETNA